jgi:hypothetical protein
MTDKKECKHSYSWSGKIPCTGVYRCAFCGKLQNENSFNGKSIIISKEAEIYSNIIENQCDC